MGRAHIYVLHTMAARFRFFLLGCVGLNSPSLFTSFSVNRKDSWDAFHVLQVECRSDGQTQDII